MLKKLFLLLTIASLFVFPSSIKAQLNEGFFTCQWQGSFWGVADQDCLDDNQGMIACQGSIPPSNPSSPCGGGTQSCPLPCSPQGVETVNWGDSCNPGDLCTENSTCIPDPGGSGNRCLKTNVGAGGNCKQTSECGISSTSGSNMVCSGGKCIDPGTCDTQGDPDEFCRQQLGNDQAYCYKPAGTCNIQPSESPEFPTNTDWNLCEQVPPAFTSQCTGCQGSGGVWTAIGCINTQSDATLAQSLITFGVGIAGGIAALIMLLGAFTIATSQSNPEKLKQGQELFTAAIAGLTMIVFSVVILNLIGAEILQIPGF